MQPSTMEPLYYKPLEILTHIAVDVVPTKPHGSLKVLYVATAEGTVKKITILPKSSVTCTLEEWNIFPESSSSSIMALHYLKITVRVDYNDFYPSASICVNVYFRICVPRRYKTFSGSLIVNSAVITNKSNYLLH